MPLAEHASSRWCSPAAKGLIEQEAFLFAVFAVRMAGRKTCTVFIPTVDQADVNADQDGQQVDDCFEHVSASSLDETTAWATCSSAAVT